jgi:hypothetical protein
VVRAKGHWRCVVNKKTKTALFGLKDFALLEMHRTGYRNVILDTGEGFSFLSSASQGSYGEERDLVWKWLPAVVNRLLLKPGRHW